MRTCSEHTEFYNEHAYYWTYMIKKTFVSHKILFHSIWPIICKPSWQLYYVQIITLPLLSTNWSRKILLYTRNIFENITKREVQVMNISCNSSARCFVFLLLFHLILYYNKKNKIKIINSQGIRFYGTSGAF